MRDKMQEEMNEQQEMQPEGAPPADPMMAEQQAQIEQIAATAPMPEKPYTYKAIDKFADAMNAFVGGIDPNMAAAEYNPPEGEKKLDAPLPAEVYVPFAVIMGFISQLGGFDKYIMRPEDLVSDTALSKGAANFKRMGKDKKLNEALKAGPEAPPAEQDPAMSDAEMEAGRMPGSPSPEDEEIMNMM
tara:strand:- start:8074 stop:8634 length:561 start_codon:yes stop_codon:yes gene_type:complete